MSTEATWDLYANYSPRSLCVFPVPTTPATTTAAPTGGTTPSGSAKLSSSRGGTNTSNAVAVVYGTDRGSLHYRCYRTSSSSSSSQTTAAARSGFFSAAAAANTTSSSSGNNNNKANVVLSSSSAAASSATPRIVSPLGMSSGGQQPPPTPRGLLSGSAAGAVTTTSLPRTLYPVDLKGTTLPGPIVSTLLIATHHQNEDASSSSDAAAFPLLLVLVDDPRGSSASQPGAYSAYWVALQHGTFQVFSNAAAEGSSQAFCLPRLSAAVASHGRVYATAGRSVFTLRVPTVPSTPESTAAAATSDATKPHKKSTKNNKQQQAPPPRLQFGPRVWPGPVRCGPDALAVVAEGRVVVGCVGHAFYAVAGEEIHRDEDEDEEDEDDEAMDESYNTRVLFDGGGGGTGSNPNASSATGAGGGVDASGGGGDGNSGTSNNNCVKLVHWTQSSQVHPVVALDLGDTTVESAGPAPAAAAGLDADWSCLFLANGRECAVVDLYYGPSQQPRLSGSNKPRNGIVTTASPILAAAASWPFVAILMSDGLCSVRSPSCLAVSLRTVEIGTRPNDFFTLRPVRIFSAAAKHSSGARTSVWGSSSASASSASVLVPTGASSAWSLPWIVGISYAGEAKVLQCKPDTAQDLADRLMRHAIDAFGGNGFPRTDLAQAVPQASFTATSYVGPEPTPQARALLKEYLEAVLGLCDWESGASSGWPTQETMLAATTPMSGAAPTRSLAAADGEGGGFQGKWSGSEVRTGGNTGNTNAGSDGGRLFSSVLTASQPAALLTHTAMLCLVASQLSPPAAVLASRAAKACAVQMGVVLARDMDPAAVSVGQQVTDQLLRESSQAFSLSSPAPKTPAIPRMHRPAQVSTDYIEASIWLLRSCGQHERAMEVAAERLQQNPTPEIMSSLSNISGAGGGGSSSSVMGSARSTGQWSRIKYESYTATHLSELWCCAVENSRGSSVAGADKKADGMADSNKDDDARELVLRSAAAHALLESNPRLGLSVFTSLHPQNESQWRSLTTPREEPFFSTNYVFRVLELLKSIRPKVPYSSKDEYKAASGGSGSGRSTPDDDDQEESIRHRSSNSYRALPLESGRALAVTFLESAMGISTGRPASVELGSSQTRSPTVGSGDGAFDMSTATVQPDEQHEQVVANFHDELALLLLEGVLSERSDNETLPAQDEEDSELGQIYRAKLRYFLRWPLAKIRPEQFMESLPPSFLPEKALVLGRLGRHEDALRILYRDLRSLDMALEYCDDRHQRQQLFWDQQQQRQRARQEQAMVTGETEDDDEDDNYNTPQPQDDDDNAYLPLVRVALEASLDDTDKEESKKRAAAAAVQVLSLRRASIDRAAALRLLPPDISVSAVARPFLIPALVDSESQVRRLTVVSALLRARYLRLKEQLTTAQLKAQANLQVVPQLQSLKLGDPLHSTKPFRARTSASGGVSSGGGAGTSSATGSSSGGGGSGNAGAGSSNSGAGSTGNGVMPEVWIVKHFFPRHLVIQARVTNQAGLSDKAGRTLTDIAFVVAESSEEAIQPLMQVPIAVLPSSMTGSTWCVLSAAPTRMEGSTAQLTCELRYTVGQGDLMALGGTSAANMMGRTYVEELQDLEVHASHF